jgi:hypothetical protein
MTGMAWDQPLKHMRHVKAGDVVFIAIGDDKHGFHYAAHSVPSLSVLYLEWQKGIGVARYDIFSHREVHR